MNESRLYLKGALHWDRKIMKVLVLNPGSSSLRFAIISADPPSGEKIQGEGFYPG